ncbi:UNVERIFIED_CONTAM: Meiotic nuclear division protein 1 [Sesamum angustifolium]|uniref:Meiotic nuclear division protein 1 n=1 Tax=Sesamum angustifolium TaxID=2727405 RepID=A0AAW2MS80_9LAMI
MTLSSKTRLELLYIFGVFLAVLVNQLRNIHRKLDSDLESSKKRYTELIDQCNALKKGREESDEREEALDELKAIEQKYNGLKDEIVQYSDNDPATFEAMNNIFTLRQWCSNNFPQAKEQLDHLYNEVGITDDFDYLELPAAAPVCSAGDQMLEGKP